jgi:hypothetical protein
MSIATTAHRTDSSTGDVRDWAFVAAGKPPVRWSLNGSHCSRRPLSPGCVACMRLKPHLDLAYVIATSNIAFSGFCQCSLTTSWNDRRLRTAVPKPRPTGRTLRILIYCLTSHTRLLVHRFMPTLFSLPLILLAGSGTFSTEAEQVTLSCSTSVVFASMNTQY